MNVYVNPKLAHGNLTKNGKTMRTHNIPLGKVMIIVASVTFASTPGQADDAAARAGQELAQKKCSPCHVITPSGQSQTHSGAPSFEEIAAGSKRTREALRAFLLSTNSNVSHPGGMPAPRLTEDQIDLIFAYLSSLRERH
jgi:mono/diheme cytochrome c family protein